MAQQNDNLLVTIFEETGHVIRYKAIDKQLWICARDLAKPLGISGDAILKRISKFSPILEGRVEVYPLDNGNNAKFLNKKATLTLVMESRSTNKSIKMFKSWCIDKLDELLTNGKVSLFERRLCIAENWTKALLPTMTDPLTDQKTKTFANSMVQNTSNRLNEYNESNIEEDIPMGIENRLILKYKLTDPERIRSLSVKIGKRAAAMYRAVHDEEPSESNEIVWNQIKTNIKMYYPEDYADWLDKLIEQQIQ